MKKKKCNSVCALLSYILASFGEGDIKHWTNKQITQTCTKNCTYVSIIENFWYNFLQIDALKKTLCVQMIIFYRKKEKC